MFRSTSRIAHLALTVVGSAALASAQTVITGALSDSTTGPLTPGVYVVNGIVSVASGQTLTIHPGAIVKFPNGSYFAIDGTVLANGNAGNTVIFTDVRDDSAGGDTNGNGPSSGVAGHWYGLIISGAGANAATLAHCEVRYAGFGGNGGITLNGAAATLSNVLVRDGFASGIDLSSSPVAPTITNCTVQGNGGRAVERAHIQALPGFHNLTALDNGLNHVRVTNAVLTSSVTLAPSDGVNGAFFFDSTLTVPTGATLTLQAGCVLKFQNGQYAQIDGTLVTNGSGGSKVIFTDYRDDTAGGDSNGGGVTVGAPGWWYGVYLNDGSDASVLSHAELRFAGFGSVGAFELSNSNATLSNCLVRNAFASGLDLNASNSRPTVSACSFQNNGGRAIDGVRIESLAGFSGNSATGNAFNQLRLTVATVSAPTTIAPANGINGAIYVEPTLVVPAGQSLTIQAGSVLKFANGQYAQVDGQLVAQGSSGNPVVFTDYRDDSVGGDTNGGGASSGAAGWWYGLYFNATSDASALDFFEVRFAGFGSVGAFEITDSDLQLSRGVIRNCFSSAIDLNSSGAKPVINRCLIQNNGGIAITGVAIAAVPFITRNTATGNAQDQLLVTSSALTSDVYIDGNAGVNDVVTLQGTLSVPAGRRLTLGPGAALKFQNGQFATVAGELVVRGTATDPVVMTDVRDDSVGGDSNGGGASSGAPGWWYGLYLPSGATLVDVEHLRLRYAGFAGAAAVNCDSPLASLRNVRVESSFANAFQLSAAARVSHLAAALCGAGVQLQSGVFDLEHVSVAGGTFGIRNNGTWTGNVVDSIAWGCSTNYFGLPNNQVRYSCGYSGGGVGNLNVDPLFVNAANGDLRLQAGSPCIDTGDPFAPSDADCTRSDMGAYPSYTPSAPQTYCVGKSNSVGCTPYLDASGFASATLGEPFEVRAYNIVNNRSGLLYYGFSGRANGPFQGGTKCVADPVRRLPIQNSGGNGGIVDCSGRYAVDFNALIQSGTDPLLVPGAVVNVQCWYRDPGVPSSTGLSNGLEFRVRN